VTAVDWTQTEQKVTTTEVVERAKGKRPEVRDKRLYLTKKEEDHLFKL
jgi:hypothetical protein